MGELGYERGNRKICSDIAPGGQGQHHVLVTHLAQAVRAAGVVLHDLLARLPVLNHPAVARTHLQDLQHLLLSDAGQPRQPQTLAGRLEIDQAECIGI